jgi:hypothetical protein
MTATGLCRVCEETVRVRKDGCVRQHPRSDGVLVATLTDAGWVQHVHCAGSGRPPSVVLELTFPRWLHRQRGRRDWRESTAAQLARHVFGEPGGCGDRGPGEVDWETAEGLHAELHQEQLRATGSELRQPYNGQRCDWVCRFAEEAGREYAAAVN